MALNCFGTHYAVLKKQEDNKTTKRKKLFTKPYKGENNE